jgi:hypothetical protein
LAIGSREHCPIALPSITVPRERSLAGSLERGVHRGFDEVFVEEARSLGHHEAALPVLH